MIILHQRNHGRTHNSTNHTTTNIDITTIKRYKNEHNIWFISHKISISDNLVHGYETSQWHTHNNTRWHHKILTLLLLVIKIRVSAWLETTPQDKQHFWIDIHVQTPQGHSRAGCTIAGGSTQTDKLLRWWWWWWWWWWCGGWGACVALVEGGKGGSKSACAPVE